MWSIGALALAGLALTASLLLAHHGSGAPPPAQAAGGVSPGSCHRRAPAARHGLLIGLHANLGGLNGRSRCSQAQLARATGVQGLREDLSWATTEPRPGRFDWSHFDAVVVSAARQGLSVLPVLDDTPRWAGREATTIPAQPARYARFAAAAARRYGPGGSFWRAHPSYASLALGWLELWNEPYLPDFAAGGPNPAVYANLVRASVRAARAANPRARFLLEAETIYATRDSTQRSWIEGMYAAVPDLSRFFDAVAVHPYSTDPPATALRPGDSRQQTRRLEEIHASFAAHGDGAKPLWATEIGWPTCGRADCVTEAQQAAYLASFLALARTTWSGFLAAAYIYDLGDFRNKQNPREGSFGVLRIDRRRKPAWSVLHAGG